MPMPVGSSTPNQIQTSGANALQDSSAAKTPDAPQPQDTNSAGSKATDGRSKVAEYQLDGQLKSAALSAQAEREMAPVGPNTTVDITNTEMRNQLLRSTPQINPISTAAGNAPSLCGGAATANALVLSSKTPEQAKANATAVRDIAKSFTDPVKLSASEDAALKHMEAGKMSPTDVEHLQQVMFRIGHKMPAGGLQTHNDTGLSTTQMGSMMTVLGSKGAFAGSSVTMHCNTVPPNGFDHWTTTVDGVHANSQFGKDNKSMVMGGPPAELSKGHSDWQNELWLNTATKPAEMTVQYRGKDDNDKQYRQATINTGKYPDVFDLANLEAEMYNAKKESL